MYITFTEMWLRTMGANITKDVVKLFLLVSSELSVCVWFMSDSCVWFTSDSCVWSMNDSCV